jgi:hypothetical protein
MVGMKKSANPKTNFAFSGKMQNSFFGKTGLCKHGVYPVSTLGLRCGYDVSTICDYALHSK